MRKEYVMLCAAVLLYLGIGLSVAVPEVRHRMKQYPYVYRTQPEVAVIEMSLWTFFWPVPVAARTIGWLLNSAGQCIVNTLQEQETA